MKYAKAFIHILLLSFFFSLTCFSEIIYKAEMEYKAGGVIEGRTHVIISNHTADKELIFFFHQNSYKDESKLSKFKVNYLYPDGFNPGQFQIFDLRINNVEIDLQPVTGDVYIPLPLLDDNINTEIIYSFKSSYPSRIGPVGYRNNTLSSLYPPYPLIAEFSKEHNTHSLISSEHCINIAVPDNMVLLGEFSQIEAVDGLRFYKAALKSLPFYSFSIVPEDYSRESLFINDLEICINFSGSDSRTISNLFFSFWDMYLFFIHNTAMRPEGRIEFAPASIENDLLINGMGLVYFDPNLIAVKPKFRTLVDFNIIRVIMLEFLDLAYPDDKKDIIFLTMLNEFLSEKYYLYCHNEFPQIPKSLFALSLVTSVDLNDLYETLDDKYGFSLDRSTLTQSYNYYIGRFDNNFNLYSILKKLIGIENAQKELSQLLKKNPSQFDLKEEFYLQMSKSGFMDDIENFLDMESRKANDPTDNSRNTKTGIRGRGSLSRYSLGLENNPRLLKLFDDSSRTPYYFYANSQILIEPLDLSIGYIYKFFIAKDDILKPTYGLSIEKFDHTLDGKIFYKIMLGRQLTPKKSQFELQVFSSYELYKDAKTIENETDKIYFFGFILDSTNRTDDFQTGYSLSLTCRSAISKIFGIYDFQNILFDLDFNHYWTEGLFTKYDFQAGILAGDRPSFIHYTYSSYNKAVSGDNNKIKNDAYLGFGIEAGTVLKKNIGKNLFDIFTLLRLEGSVFAEACLLGSKMSDFGNNYCIDIGFRIGALTLFQNLIPVMLSFDIAFPLDSINFSDIYFRIKIKEIF